MQRIAEAYIGEYAAGKSELAVNRAVELAKAGRRVTLVDLDLVEPAYTLRALEPVLAPLGVALLAQTTAATAGLGEAGMTLLPAARFALTRPGDVIFDLGYGVQGQALLHLLEGDTDELRRLLVVNPARPMTATAEQIIATLPGRIDGLIANGHRGADTGWDDILRGLAVAREVAARCDLPIDACALEQQRSTEPLPPELNGVPLRFLKRYMPNSFW